ncbi:MAG TPA: hypothetical protein DCZ94_04795 [Lentisphaeria bacterium]|nr:MAG: hypothetical protein A2X48_19980 [Lentisphaerae bacterium GWF2_49_21]HBC86254.1 hypothetical protein [Lentisphaeria bacterium]
MESYSKTYRLVKILIIPFLLACIAALFLVFFHERASKEMKATFSRPTISEAHMQCDGAVLDLKSALVFELKDGRFGYVYVSRVGIAAADYTCTLLSKSVDGKVSVDAAASGRFLYEGGGQEVKCGDFGMCWLPATAFFFRQNLKASIIPIEDKGRIERGDTSFIKWTDINLPSM